MMANHVYKEENIRSMIELSMVMKLMSESIPYTAPCFLLFQPYRLLACSMSTQVMTLPGRRRHGEL